MSAIAEATPSAATALPTPEGIQEEVVSLKPEGHAVILGTSGSGKTALAILRALFLSDPSKEHAGKTLLVTYNKSLLAYLTHFIPQDAPNLEASTFHRFARSYLDERGKLDGAGTVIGNHKLALVKQALEQVRSTSTDEILKKPTGFFVDELDWMVQNGHLTADSYLEADRSERGNEISKESRKAVFDIQEAYWRLRSEVGKRYDAADIAAATHAALKEDNGERRYRHVVIDDGQDFSSEMLRALALAVPKEGGSLTFFADTTQQIYRHGSRWRTAGFDISEPMILTKNYRNSPEIAKLAAAIADMPFVKEQPDMVKATEFAAPGPLPELAVLPDRDAEDAFVVERAEALAATGSVAVLCRRDADAVRIGEKLSNATHLHKEMSTWQPQPGVLYGNVHSAKGYEFQSVILVGVIKGRWPERRMVNSIGEDKANVMDGRLLHVAVSRAQQNLIMTATRELTPLLPANDGLWVEKQFAPPPASPKSNSGESASSSAAELAPPANPAAKAPQATNGAAEQGSDSAAVQEDASPAQAENGSAAAESMSNGAAATGSAESSESSSAESTSDNGRSDNGNSAESASAESASDSSASDSSASGNGTSEETVTAAEPEAEAKEKSPSKKRWGRKS